MEIGSVVGGRYRITGAGYGRVWFATDIGSGQPVALKTPAEAPGPATRLRHPGIVAVLDAGEHGGSPFIAMERLDGYTFDDHLLDGGYAAAQVADFGAQIAQALASAHRAGITHDRIDPAHLFLTHTGTVKILGFGTTALAPTPDLVALGTTMDELLAFHVARDSVGELGTLMSELRHTGSVQDPQLTDDFAVRLRRLADELAEAEPAARPPRPPQRPERRATRWALAVATGAVLIAVAAYAFAVAL